MIAIIDYDAGNTMSVQKAVAKLGHDYALTRDSAKILGADHVILPGVGAFGDAMGRLRSYGLDEILKDVCKKGTPLLGICLGLQLLFERSDEAPGVKGLGMLNGEILRIPDQGGMLKIPHMGWNNLSLTGNGRLFCDITDNSWVYFVHSYYLHEDDRSIVKAVTRYGVTIDASVEKDNVFACQFHPEKSSGTGLKILDNFLRI